MKILFALLLALPGWLQAQPDPLKSPACAQALAGLDAARADDARGAQVPALRNQAAQACLGGNPALGRTARVLQAPITVPPPALTPPPLPETMAQPRRPPPPVALARPALPALCDTGGCWASDGGRLRHVGPNLAGPTGMCAQHGGQVLCP